MTPRCLLAVSPHLDDAIFSAGGTLARRAREGWRVVVATCFTGNVAHPAGFALACQLDKGIGPDVDYMALRRAEDRAACAAVGAEPIHLPLLEAPHRGYDSAAALFADRRLPADDVLPPLTEALRTLIAGLRPDVVLGPAGMGRHVDHLVVRSALAACAATTLPVGLWEDWPYADRVQAVDPVADVLSGTVETVALSADDIGRKITACRAYTTQLAFQFGSADAMASRLARIGIERFRTTPGDDGAGFTTSAPAGFLQAQR